MRRLAPRRSTMSEMDSTPRYTRDCQEAESPIDDAWISSMSSTVDNIEGLTFELGKGDEFTFTLQDDYKNQLKDKTLDLMSSLTLM